MGGTVRRELLGYADVDSGQLCVVDPCYVLDDDRYRALIDQWDDRRVNPNAKEQLSVPVKQGYASGVNFNTAWGDGSYAVYGEVDGDGRILRVIIEMDSESDEDDFSPEWTL